MPITPQQARSELARRELARRGVSLQAPQSKPMTPNQQSFQEVGNVANSGKGLAGKAWDALAVPGQMSERGMKSIADMIPQPEPKGNMAMDLLKGTPSILAKSALQVPPKFIDRASLLAEAAGPAMRLGGAAAAKVGPGLGRQLEELSGAAKGSLGAAWNDAKTMFRPGKKAAGALYEDAKMVDRTGAVGKSAAGYFDAKGVYNELPTKELEKLKETMNKTLSHKEFIDAADRLADHGALEPHEALEARKSVDKLLKTKGAPIGNLFKLRAKLGALAQTDERIAQADRMYQQGVNAESLRNVFPQNKYGGASPWKIMMGTLIGRNNPLGVAMDATAFSPMAQGAASTAGGLAARKVLGPLSKSAGGRAAAVQLLKQFRKDDENSNP